MRVLTKSFTKSNVGILGIVILLLLPTNIASSNISAKTVSGTSLPNATVLFDSILDVNSSALIRMLNDTGAQLVFRADFKWGKMDLNSFDKLSARISEVKAAIPGVSFIAGITCSALEDGDYWANGTTISAEQRNQMMWILPNGTAPRHIAQQDMHVLDINKTLARQFVLSYLYRYVDVGFDGFSFDEVDYVSWQSGWQIPVAPYLEAWKEIVQDLRDYALTKYDRKILVSINNGFMSPVAANLPTPYPDQDFITVSFSKDTIQSQSAVDDWSDYKQKVVSTYGHLVPILADLDWGVGSTPLSLFANLPVDQQISMLKLFHEISVREDITFAYPVHGGVVSYSWPTPGVVYDSIEQGTFDTIASLSKGSTTTSFDFSISVSPNSGSVVAGQALSSAGTVTLTLASGSAQPVSLSSSGLPSNVGTTAFSPTSCSPTCTSSFSITTFSNAPTCTYNITITGTAGGLQRSTTYSLTVTGQFDFSLSIPSGITVIQGGSSQNTVQISLVSRSTQPVSLSYTNQFGSPTPVTLTTTAIGYWFDYGSSWTLIPNPLSGFSNSYDQ